MPYTDPVYMEHDIHNGGMSAARVDVTVHGLTYDEAKQLKGHVEAVVDAAVTRAQGRASD